jgi:hypothetical protein
MGTKIKRKGKGTGKGKEKERKDMRAKRNESEWGAT